MNTEKSPSVPPLSNFLKQAECYPDTIAIWSEDGSYTYKEICDYAFAAATALQRRGIKTGDIVTIELPCSREYAGLCLAVWICGAVFVASDIAYPQARRDYIAQDCNAKLRIDNDFLESFEIELGEKPILHIPELDDIAFLIYTSGTTGKPKGVIHTHRGLLASDRRHAIISEAGPTVKWASPASFSFITGLVPMFTCLETASGYYIVPKAARKNPDLLSDFLAEHDVDVMFLPPALIPFFKQKKKTLRTIFTGSDRVIDAYSDEFRIVNCWGLTETCEAVLVFDIDKPYKNTPIGFPICDERVYILDENNHEVEEGELCCTGHLGIGYYGLPEETAKTFLPNPFKEIDGFDLLIRTGDRGRRLADGAIQFIGRLDWMVNINGQRIEPGEVSATIEAMPQILHSTVTGYDKPNGQVCLVAYYQPVVPVTEDQIRKAINESLPPYMMPEVFIAMDEMPLNINGKVDRLALPNPFESLMPANDNEQNDATEQPAVPFPDDPLVDTIRQLMQKCSGRSDFGYEDDLTLKGVSSLVAIEFCVAIETEVGVTIPVTDLLGGCSVKSIEEKIREKQQ